MATHIMNATGDFERRRRCRRRPSLLRLLSSAVGMFAVAVVGVGVRCCRHHRPRDPIPVLGIVVVEAFAPLRRTTSLHGGSSPTGTTKTTRVLGRVVVTARDLSRSNKNNDGRRRRFRGDRKTTTTKYRNDGYYDKQLKYKNRYKNRYKTKYESSYDFPSRNKIAGRILRSRLLTKARYKAKYKLGYKLRRKVRTKIPSTELDERSSGQRTRSDDGGGISGSEPVDPRELRDDDDEILVAFAAGVLGLGSFLVLADTVAGGGMP